MGCPGLPAGGQEKGEPTSGLEPLSCSLRVIGHMLLGFAEACKSRISRRFPLLWVAECCTTLHSRWYQSGIRQTRDGALVSSNARERYEVDLPPVQEMAPVNRPTPQDIDESLIEELDF